MKKIITFLKIVGLMALAFLSVQLLLIFPDEYVYLFTNLSQFLLLFIIAFKLLSIYWQCFVFFMLNETYKGYNKNIEKPRLLLHLIFFPISIFFMVMIRNFPDSNGKIKSTTNILNIVEVPNSIILTLFIFGFIISVLVMFTTWTKKFEKSYIPMMKEQLTPQMVILEFKEILDIEEIYTNELIKNNRCEVSFDNFKLFASGKKMSDKIKWIDKKGQKSTKDAKNKDITFGFIFDMLHENIINGGIKNLTGQKRSLIMDLITENFTKENEIIKKVNINKAYSNWKPNS